MNLSRNAIWNFAEVVATSAAMFVTYALMSRKLGLSDLGIWSLVLATTSVARFADFGAAAGLGRYVAAVQEADKERALLYVETGLTTTALVYLVLGAVCYWPASYALSLATSGAAQVKALELLPYAILSFVMLNITSVIYAALIGFHNSRWKSALAIAGAVLQTAVVAATVDPYGLRAVAAAQVCQLLFAGIAGWAAVVRSTRGRWAWALPTRWSRAAFAEIVGLGARLQVLNIVSLGFDPVCKFMLSTMGGLHVLGLYEMASRAVMQIRQLIIAPTQNLTPLFVTRLNDTQALQGMYERAVVALSIGGAAALMALTACAPLLSVLFLGDVNWQFVLFVGVLAAAWWVNIVAVPAYYLGIAAGQVSGNVAGAAASLVLSVVGGLFGAAFGAIGVVSAIALAIAVGAVVTLIINCTRRGFSAWPPGDRYVAHALSFGR